MTTEEKYQERLNRYLTAMDVGKPDRVPVRLNLGDVMATIAGLRKEEIYYQLEKNVVAAKKVIEELDPDVGPLFPSLWSASVHDAVGARYYKFAGRQLGPDEQFQFFEAEYMKGEDYDDFIRNPTQWLLQTYLPRLHEEFAQPGSYRANLALIKGVAGQMELVQAMVAWDQQMIREYGVPPAYAGIIKAPFDTLGDTLRGMRGILTDLHRRPEKVIEATEVLVEHNLFYGIASGGGNTTLPAFMPMHRGSYPFLSPKQWDTFYWPSLKRMTEEAWKRGKRIAYYAEADWTPYLDRFAQLPDKSIVFHVDKTDMAQAKKVLGGRFCLSGGVPNQLLAYGTPQEVRDFVKRLLDDYAGDGGFILDAGSVILDPARLENLRAMVETARDYGRY
jgi:hypothetical protein